MEDIAKGLKIAGALGGAAIKAAKTIQDTLQTAQGTQSTPAQRSSSQSSNQQSQRNQVTQNQPPPNQYQAQSQPSMPQSQYQAGQSATTNQDAETLFCDQCGAPVRPGKHFCNQCGAKLP
jgi:hypothetical protein